jgi:REP element-mobilizing transposase RayT
MARRPRNPQLSLSARGSGRGGYRAGAGRKPKAPEDRQGHHPRPALASRHPVHVTLKVLPTAPHLRRGVCFRSIRSALARGKDRFGFRLVHFTVQGNHLHLLCEAKDRRALSRGMQGLSIRVARNLNKKVGRTGKLFAARYHERILRTPTEVRRALVYVLGNSRRHAPDQYTARSWIDPCSSAPWFDGWRHPPPREPHFRPEGETPVVAPGTWLLAIGWRRGGLLDPGEAPVGDR